MKRIIWLSMAFVATATVSCLDQGIEEQQDVRISNGRLVFPTEEVYRSTLQSLSALSGKELAEWQNKNFPGFVSLKSAYEGLTDKDKTTISAQGSNKGYENILTLLEEDDGEFEAVMNVDRSSLATLVSNKGLVQIGNEVLRVGYSDVRVVKYSGEADLDALNAINWKELPEGSKIYTVERKVTVFENGRTKARVGTCEDRYKSDRRFKGELWLTNTAPAYAGTGARSKHQNRFLRVWWADNAPQIRLQASGTLSQVYSCIDGQFTRSVSADGFETNENIIEIAWFESFNMLCRLDIEATVTSSGVGDDGSSHGCTIW